MEENGSTVLREVDELLRKIDAARPSLRQRLLDFVEESLDLECARCKLSSYALPGGQILYSAVVTCPECGDTHTYLIVANRDDTFTLAYPASVSEN